MCGFTCASHKVQRMRGKLLGCVFDIRDFLNCLGGLFGIAQVTVVESLVPLIDPLYGMW
jgi:hypothetical protein